MQRSVVKYPESPFVAGDSGYFFHLSYRNSRMTSEVCPLYGALTNVVSYSIYTPAYSSGVHTPIDCLSLISDRMFLTTRPTSIMSTKANLKLYIGRRGGRSSSGSELVVDISPIASTVASGATSSDSHEHRSIPPRAAAIRENAYFFIAIRVKVNTTLESAGVNIPREAHIVKQCLKQLGIVAF